MHHTNYAQAGQYSPEAHAKVMAEKAAIYAQQQVSAPNAATSAKPSTTLEALAELLRKERERLSLVRDRFERIGSRAFGDPMCDPNKDQIQGPGIVGVIGAEVDQLSSEISRLSAIADRLDQLA